MLVKVGILKLTKASQTTLYFVLNNVLGVSIRATAQKRNDASNIAEIE